MSSTRHREASLHALRLLLSLRSAQWRKRYWNVAWEQRGRWPISIVVTADPAKRRACPAERNPFKAWLSLEAGSRERAAQLLKLETELKEEKCSRQSS
jgi:hypothetical protein